MDHRGTERRSTCWMFVVLLSCVSNSRNSAVAGEDAGGQALIGTPTSVAIGPGKSSTPRSALNPPDDRHRSVCRRFGPRPDPPSFLDQPRSRRGDGLGSGAGFPQGQRNSHHRGTARVDRVKRGRQGPADGPAIARELPPRRDSSLQPGRMQHGCLPRGTDRQGGFRLSLRGYLPDQDFLTLSREAGGRRINIMATESSLLLTKPLGEVAHEGGLRLSRNSKSYELLRDWIKEAARDTATAPAPVKLEIVPESRVP